MSAGATGPPLVMAEDGSLEPYVEPPPAFDEPARQALDWLLFMVARNGGRLPFYLDGSPAPSVSMLADDGHARNLLLARVERYLGRQIELGLPNESTGQTVLWAWVESGEQERRAHRFRPAPSMVLKLGRTCRRLLLWALEEPAIYPSLVAANRQLAYALHAPQKYAEPSHLRIPVPGSSLHAGRKTPCPVHVTRLSTTTFKLGQVAGRLKSPPPPYMERLRRGEVTR